MNRFDELLAPGALLEIHLRGSEEDPRYLHLDAVTMTAEAIPIALLGRWTANPDPVVVPWSSISYVTRGRS